MSAGNRLFLRYALALVAVGAALLLREALGYLVGPGLPTYVTFYPAVMLVALLAGIGPGVLARKQANGSWVYSVTRKPRTVQSFSTPHAVRMRDTLSSWFCFMRASLSG